MTRRKFSLEFKQRTIEQVRSEQHVVQVSRQHDLAVSTINGIVQFLVGNTLSMNLV
ncbi:transposase [Pasteuria penetrans]|uniref:transposase n=1 Tax=Pasteuria penetrans TaxID=86005 RepID=UPI0011ECF931|nr:transposase [Pasteuria penetrans]